MREKPLMDHSHDNPSTAPTFATVAAHRLSRRAALKGLFVSAGSAVLAGTVSRYALLPGDAMAAASAAETSAPALSFQELTKSISETHQVAKGYSAQVVLSWGDALHAGMAAFDPQAQTAAEQEKRFGYNNDFVGFLPLPAGSKSSDHGLLCVNHEYSNTELMFPGLPADGADKLISEEQAKIEMAAHGHSVVEIKKDASAGWQVVTDSAYNRRISFLSTVCDVTGPAAGHPRLRTKADPSGRSVIGTLNNCAGGKTPWGTILTAEENFHQYFAGDPTSGPEAANHKRMGIKNKPGYGWGRFFERMDVEQEPNEPNRFGWLVEIDPYDPHSKPKKRTALGRFKHEAGTTVINPDGRVTVYSGDDTRFEYLYRFVSKGTYNLTDRAANMTLLDDGVLSVARFDADGSLAWLPLIHGQGPLTEKNGFASQADVLIEARRAGDLVGATPMDRPEDVETNPVNGKVYVMLTNNTKRTAEQADGANPRGPNPFGHVLELTAPGGTGTAADHTADAYLWDILLLAGDPGQPDSGAKYHPDVSANGWLAAPDNCTFDAHGRLWISTDQGGEQAKRGNPDGIFACQVDGAERALTKFFYAVPRDAEMCGPEFTPDGKTLFVAVQHPGEGSTFDSPSTRFPRFSDNMPPLPSVVAISKDDGGEIGA
jgi:secreted PhoX family phosphatase